MFPSVWLPVIFALSLLEGMNTSLFNTTSRTKTHMHSYCLPFFLCIISSFIAFSFLRCQSRLYVSMALCCALWWAHFKQSRFSKSAASFNRYRQGLSLCPWICATYSIFIFLFIYSVHIAIRESLCLLPFVILSPTSSDSHFPFHPPSFLYFDFSECRTLLVSFSVLSGETTCGEVNTILSLYCLQLTPVQLQICFYPISCFKGIVFKWDMRC